MKKIILLLSITTLMLQSCSSESDNNSKLFGRWYIVSDISNGTNITHTICSNNGNRDYC